MLLEAGADPNARGNAGLTALHYAAEAGNGQIIRKLLDHGAEVDAEADDEQFGDTPLCRAVWEDCFEAAEILLDAGASIHHALSDGFNPLLLAIEYDCLDTMRMLIRRGADIKSIPHRLGGNALHVAASAGHSRVVEVLLELCNDSAFVDQRRTTLARPRSASIYSSLGVSRGRFWRTGRRVIWKNAFLTFHKTTSLSFIGFTSSLCPTKEWSQPPWRLRSMPWPRWRCHLRNPLGAHLFSTSGTLMYPVPTRWRPRPRKLLVK
ncbi:ankyrin repeat domain-containing protein 52 [Colletotrichum plurivorum]|uniref:Ankyrin repeat domain-containing protein 52 n=1 Tax=Colletotrichum plurivorum TaxID=2175906 RepID=A0A8H6N3R7_9PEZI|nr:ankyrin repeat domain-containing protein 52 [Colletotrichum plurivorum]